MGMQYKGTRGNDDFTGTSGRDTFQMGQGGNDTVDAGGGDDLIIFGAAFTAQDSVNGGAGGDTLVLNGDYTGAHAVTMLATTLTNVETITLTTGHSYDLVTSDPNVAAGEELNVIGAALSGSNTLTFDGSAETDGYFRITGGYGNDVLTGGANADTFALGRGGDDTVHGGGGNDRFQMHGALSPGDQIDGGSGSDVVELNGDYSGAHAVVLLDTTLTNIETIVFAGGFSYDLTTADGNVAAGQVLIVDAAALGTGYSLTFNGAAEKDGRFAIAGGAGDDVLTGGAKNDIFNLTHGGNDIAHGGGGNDTFNLGAAFTSADRINGGAGTDTLNLNGDYSAGVTLGPATLTNVETIVLAAGHSYDLRVNDNTVAPGQTLTIDGLALGAGDTLTLNGGAETDGNFNIAGGSGNNTLIGGSNDDVLSTDSSTGSNSFRGGGGADSITGSPGTDTFVYDGASDSTSANYDTILGADLSVDRFDVPGTVNGIDTAVTSGTLSTTTFDSDMATALNGHLLASDAILFTPDSGELSGQTFLVVDLNGMAGYQSGADLVIHLSGYSGTPTTSDFV
jgi:Ca2+-binding RTX toxin-like protein